jgi:hypothetical protein
LSAAANGLAVAVVAAGSGVQVVLYLHRFGTNHATDGFIAAFAVYALVVVVAQILRTSAVPIVSGAPPLLGRSRFGWAVASASVCATLVVLGLSEPLARLLTSSSGARARSVAEDSLLVMAPAMGLQTAAAGLAVAGGLRDRLMAVAFAYMISTVVGLVAFFVLVGPAAERVLAYTMLASSSALVVLLLLLVRPRMSRPPPPIALASAVSLLMRTTPIPASFVLMYPITLALVPRVPVGTITIFGLAFTACSYLIGATGQAPSMVWVYDHVAFGESDARELIVRAFRYSMVIATPALGVGILAGQPIVHALLAGRADRGTGFATDLLLLSPWAVATLGLWAALPAVLARTGDHRGRRTGLIVTALVAVHIVASLLGRAVWGFNGLIVVTAAAPLVFTIICLWALHPAAGRDLTGDSALILGMAAAAFGAVVPLRMLIGGGAAGGIVAGATATAVYACLVRLVYPMMGRAALAKSTS